MKLWLFVIITLITPSKQATLRSKRNSTSKRRYIIKNEETNIIRKLITFEKPKSYKKMRYACFGTSVSWGATLKHPNIEAYIKLLSPTSKNLAMRASDPSYPSVCTQSMMGNKEVFDVIVIEYERRYKEGLEALVKRVRHRFPDAIIILLNLWTYMNVAIHDSTQPITRKNTIPFRQWMMDHGFNKNTEGSWEYVKNFPNITFSFIEHHLQPRLEYFKKLVYIYNATVLQFKTDAVTFNDKGKGGDIRNIILGNLPKYATDYVHLSKIGHEYVAQKIKAIVKQDYEIKRKKQPLSRVGSWGEGDVCYNWLQHNEVRGVSESNGKLIRFSDNYGGKYALEFPKNKTGYIVIYNPLAGPRELALTFMATGPESIIYPKVQVRQEGDITTEITPHITQSNYPVHMQMIKPVGKVTPGRNIIYITALEDKQQPFRLVGYSITNDSSKISAMFLQGIIQK